MAYTTINKSTDYFRTKLYTGNASVRSITFDESSNMQPDLIWLKGRTTTASWLSNDAVRGATKRLKIDMDSADSTASGMITSFDTNGFSLGTTSTSNENGASYVSYNWLANGQGSANSDGTITTTYTSANTTAGFSIVSYTGNGTSGATVGHGLGAKPHMLIVKRLDTTGSWQTYHQKAIDTSGNPETDYMILNLTNAAQDGVNRWNDTAPTTSVFSLGNSTEVNASGGTYIAYVFSEKTGYSKFGSYDGNNSDDGPFAYTGFKPTFVLHKQYDGTQWWNIKDIKRDTTNPNSSANLSFKTDNENTIGTNRGSQAIDFLSNGFKVRTSGSGVNGTGKFIYWAFGQTLVGSNNVPCTAK